MLFLFLGYWLWQLGWVYRSPYVSAELFLSLIALGLLATAWRHDHGHSCPPGGYNGVVFILLAIYLVARSTSYPSYSAVLTLYLTVALILPRLLDRRGIYFLLALLGIVVACQGLVDVRLVQLGVKTELAPAYIGRLAGLWGNPNLLACCLLTAMACYWQLRLDSTAVRWRWAAMLPPTLMAGALFLTASRASMLALGIGLFLVFYTVYKRQGGRPALRLVALPVLTIIFGYFLAVGPLRISYASQLTTANEQVDSQSGQSFMQVRNQQLASGKIDLSAYMRFNYWASGLLMAFDHPAFGAGPGAYKQLAGDYTMPAAEALSLTYDSFETTYWPHNDYVHIAAEFGFVALLVALGCLLSILWRLFREPRAGSVFSLMALVGFSIAMIFGHPLRHPAGAMCFVLLIAPELRYPAAVSRFQPRKLAMLLLPFVCLSVVWVWQQGYRNHLLLDGLNRLQQHGGASIQTLPDVNRATFSAGYRDNTYAWEFREWLYLALAKKIWAQKDYGLALYLLPEVRDYRRVNAFYHVAYAEALLSYVVRDYAAASRAAFVASEKKPDKDEFFALHHLANILLISNQQSIPVVQLVGGEEMLHKLSRYGYLDKAQMDGDGVALPSRQAPIIPNSDTLGGVSVNKRRVRIFFDGGIQGIQPRAVF